MSTAFPQWRSRQKRCFRTTTDSAHTLPVAPNLLAQDFSADAPDKVWLTDITYVRTDEGWLYLAGVKDVFTQEIVGYAMSKRMTHELTLEALNRAVRYARPEPGLLHHSDRGSQYCASRYRERLDTQGMRVSMSRRGNCYDNAPMESFWGSLKSELLYQRRLIHLTRNSVRCFCSCPQWIEHRLSPPSSRASPHCPHPAGRARCCHPGPRPTRSSLLRRQTSSCGA